MIHTFIKENLSPLLIATFVLVLVSLLLSFISMRYSNLHVRSYDVSIAESEYASDSVSFIFNRPLDSNAEVDVTVEPEIEFSTSISATSLSVVFKEPLASDQEYTLMINEVIDIYGSGMLEPYELEFAIQPTFLYFVDQKRDIASLDTADLDTELIYRSEVGDIKKFQLFDNYILMLVGDGYVNSLYLYDRESGELKQIYENEPHIIDFALNRRTYEVYALRQDLYREEGVEIPFGVKFLVKYDILQESYLNLNFAALNFSISAFTLAPKGDSLILQEEYSNNISLVSLQDTSQVSPLGPFVSMSRFNQRGDSILFTKLESESIESTRSIIMQYGADGLEQISDPADFTIYPFFIGDSVMFSRRYDTLESERELYAISDGDSREIIKDGGSIESAAISRDMRYLAARFYTVEALMATGNFVVEPGEVPSPQYFSIFLYDLDSGEEIEIDILTNFMTF